MVLWESHLAHRKKHICRLIQYYIPHCIISIFHIKKLKPRRFVRIGHMQYEAIYTLAWNNKEQRIIYTNVTLRNIIYINKCIICQILYDGSLLVDTNSLWNKINEIKKNKIKTWLLFVGKGRLACLSEILVLWFRIILIASVLYFSLFPQVGNLLHPAGIFQIRDKPDKNSLWLWIIAFKY